MLILLDKHKLTGVRYRASVEKDEENRPTLHLVREVHGLDHDYILGHDFFLSPDYLVLGKLGSKLEGLLGQDAYIERNDKQATANSFEEVMDWLMAQARKGQNIQRYKGLGEMNPESALGNHDESGNASHVAGAYRRRDCGRRSFHHPDG